MQATSTNPFQRLSLLPPSLSLGTLSAHSPLEPRNYKHSYLNVWHFHQDHSSNFKPLLRDSRAALSFFEKTMMTSSATSGSRVRSEYSGRGTDRPAVRGNPFLKRSLLVATGQLEEQIQRDLTKIHYQQAPRGDYRIQHTLHNDSLVHSLLRNSHMPQQLTYNNTQRHPSHQERTAQAYRQPQFGRKSTSFREPDNFRRVSDRESTPSRQNEKPIEQGAGRKEITVRGMKYYQASVYPMPG